MMYIIIIFLTTDGCQQDPFDEEASRQEAETKPTPAKLVPLQDR